MVVNATAEYELLDSYEGERRPIARMVRGEYAAVVAKRLGDDGMITLVADHDADGEIMLVRPDAHLGWRGRADPDALDRWLTAVTRQGRAG